MIYLVTILIGGLLNTVRGGVHARLRATIENKIGINHTPDFKAIKPMKWYQFVVNRLLDGDTINSVGFAVFVGIFCGWPYGVLAGFAMFGGASFGWGAYINAIAHNEIQREQVEFIDRIIEPYRDEPIKWGFFGLTIRGILWGSFIGLVTNSFLPLLAGALMGCCYFPFMRYMEDKPDAWTISEAVFGAVLWVVTLCAMTI